MNTSLTSDQLKKLFRLVFAPQASDKTMTFIVDVPNHVAIDNPEWIERRVMAHEWFRYTKGFKTDLGIDHVNLFYYENVGKANADLPAWMYHWDGDPASINAYQLVKEGESVALEEILTQTDIIIAPTEFSATAPLKIAAKKFNFRGTTMPGFTLPMIPSLQIDYEKVNEIIMKFKQRLDSAVRAEILFDVDGKEYHFTADLRFRTATPSSGIFHQPGVVGNLPSGEAYIVPYEGEREDIPSETIGELPVQFDDEIVVYRVEQNRAIAVMSEGTASDKERALLNDEPAYGNIAEIGLGILGKFGCQPAGNLLMDEKLGLHIAFGRSEHFGGITSPASFRNPKNVVHIDRVYVASIQPKIIVRKVTLVYSEGSEVIMVDNEWTI